MVVKLEKLKSVRMEKVTVEKAVEMTDTVFCPSNASWAIRYNTLTKSFETKLKSGPSYRWEPVEWSAWLDTGGEGMTVEMLEGCLKLIKAAKRKKESK